jgi:radical SAM protein with 4Fe4S-binding SPASM domain
VVESSAYPSKFLIYPASNNEFLIINTLTGMADIIDESGKRFLTDKNEQENSSSLSPRMQKKMLERGYIFENAEEYDRKYNTIFHRLENELEKRFIIEINPAPISESSNDTSMIAKAGDRIGDFPEYLKIPEGMEVYRFIIPNRLYMELFEDFIRGLTEKGKKVELSINTTNINDYIDTLHQFEGKLKNIIIPGTLLTALTEETEKILDGLLQSGFNVQLNITIQEDRASYLNELIAKVIAKKWHYKPGFVLITNRGLCKKDSMEILSEEKYLGYLNAALEDSSVSNVQFDDLKLLPLVYGLIGKCKIPLAPIPAFNYCDATNNCHYIFAGDGHIYTCPRCIGLPDLAVGNYLNGLSLDKQQIQFWYYRKTPKIEECANCEIELLCGGGCAYNSWLLSRDIRKPSCLDSKEVLNNYIANNIKNISE